MARTRSSAWALASIVGATLACSGEPPPTGPRFAPAPARADVPSFALAIHPLHNPAKLLAAYQPLVDHVNARLGGGRLALEASRDYRAFELKYAAREPAFLLPNPWQALQAMRRGYRVIAMAGEPADFKGLLVVRRDSPLAAPAELRGKAVSYPSRTALAACVMPQWLLHRAGVDVNAELRNRYVGSQESSIMNVYLGLTAAGATWPPPWRAFQKEHPREAAELKVMWETEPLVNNAVMARDDVPAAVVEQLRTILLDLHRTPEGRAILAGMETARFRPATDQDYDVVRAFVARFERDVRPVEGP